MLELLSDIRLTFSPESIGYPYFFVFKFGKYVSNTYVEDAFVLRDLVLTKPVLEDS